MTMESILMFVVGLFCGALILLLWAWRFYSGKQRLFAANLEGQQQERNQLAIELAQIQSEYHQSREYYQRRIDDLNLVHERMKETFGSLSKETLIQNVDLMNSSFKQSIEQLLQTSAQERIATNEHLKNVVAPLRESLLSMDKKVGDLEAIRLGAYSGLREQIDGLLKSQAILHKETGTLAKALHAPTVRGRWGEMQLRRVVELSGMSQYCDFVEQLSIKSGDELLRPDMIVTLPKNKKIVIDAKAPLELFGDEGADSNQELVATLKRHLMVLKKKSYGKIIGESPEFTVMFLPGESFLHRALVADPMLLDFAAQNEIIIATPITLVALLKAIAFGFKQESIANNIEEVRRLAQQLIDRVHVVAGHFEKLGKNLKMATECYNQTLSSLDSRVLVTARKLSEIKSLSPDVDVALVEPLAFIDTVPREVSLRPGNEP
jgi:DNA recombination protein RmuC